MSKAKVFQRMWTEHNIQDAIDYLHAGHTTQVATAARKFNVLWLTLHSHWFGLHQLLSVLMSIGSTSAMLRNRFYVIGLSSAVMLHARLTREHFFRRSKGSLGLGHHQSGIRSSSSSIQRFNSVSHRVWIPSALKPSIVQPSTSILYNLGQFSTRKIFPGLMCITWTKKAVSEEVGGECRQLNILFRIVNCHSTSFVVGTWNLSRLLNVYVLMGQMSNLASSFWAKNFTQNGLKSMMRSGQ